MSSCTLSIVDRRSLEVFLACADDLDDERANRLLASYERDCESSRADLAAAAAGEALSETTIAKIRAGIRTLLAALGCAPTEAIRFSEDTEEPR